MVPLRHTLRLFGSCPPSILLGLCRRLAAASIPTEFTDAVPLQEYFEIIDAHLDARVAVEAASAELEKRATQVPPPLPHLLSYLLPHLLSYLLPHLLLHLLPHLLAHLLAHPLAHLLSY